MEQAATALGRRYRVADIVTGGLVLAVVTSLPNAVTAVYLAGRGRGAAVLSTALNSNAINVTAGLLHARPASPGWGRASGQDILVAGWYAGLTVLALAFAYRGRGLGRLPGAVIIAGYLAFVTALAITVAQAGVRPAVAVSALPPSSPWPAAALLLTWPPGWRPPGARRWPARWLVAAGIADPWLERRTAVALSLLLCVVIAACDAATGPHLILIGVADHRAVLRAADRPLGAHRRGRLLRPGAGGRARRAGPDLRHRDSVRVPGSGRGRRRDRDGQRCDPATPAS